MNTSASSFHIFFLFFVDMIGVNLFNPFSAPLGPQNKNWGQARSCQSFWFEYAPSSAESSLQVSRICPHRNRCTFWPKLTQVCSASTHSTAHININIKINRSSTYNNKNINKIIKTTVLSIELISSTTRVTSFKSQEEELQKDRALIRPETIKDTVYSWVTWLRSLLASLFIWLNSISIRGKILRRTLFMIECDLLCKMQSIQQGSRDAKKVKGRIWSQEMDLYLPPAPLCISSSTGQKEVFRRRKNYFQNHKRGNQF